MNNYSNLESLKLPSIGIGCWSFGGGDYWGSQDQKDVNDIVVNAYNNGISYFDTAEVYNSGQSEVALGVAVKEFRNHILIGTKISPNHLDPKNIEKYLDSSLERLQTSYIDLYQIHWPINKVSINHYTSDNILVNYDINDVLGKFQRLKEKGKILSFGVCNFGYNQLNEIHSDFTPLTNQIPYSLLFRAAEYDLINNCNSKGILTIGYNSLMQGLLTGRYFHPSDFPLNRARTRHFNSSLRVKSRTGERGFESETFLAINSIRTICNEIYFSMLDVAILWSINNIGCTLLGCRNKDQFYQNFESSQKQLPFDCITGLDTVTKNLKFLLGNHLDMYEGLHNQRTN